jgi:hypothetical protein
MKTSGHLSHYVAEFFLEREMFQTEFVEKIKTHILCSIITPPPFPFPENRAAYEIMWKNMVQPDRTQMTI